MDFYFYLWNWLSDLCMASSTVPMVVNVGVWNFRVTNPVLYSRTLQIAKSYRRYNCWRSGLYLGRIFDYSGLDCFPGRRLVAISFFAVVADWYLCYLGNDSDKSWL